MGQTAELKLPEKTVNLPIVVGSEGERAVDVTKLRAESGYITLDVGYMNTGACKSDICFIDGEKGILRYRGIPIELLAKKASFVETAYLLIYGSLPTKAELDFFTNELTYHTLLHEDIKKFLDGFPKDAHPMAILASVVCSLSTFYQNEKASGDKLNHLNSVRLLAKLPTIAAFAYKKSIGQAFIYPNNKLNYCANFLNMMFATPAEDYQIDSDIVDVLNLLLILHAEHEQNCSTSTVRMVASSQANLFACISAGICALWGPLHGGANQMVIEMLEEIHRDGGNVKKYVEMAKDKNSEFRLFGFGHRVYKNYDPRAAIIKEACDKVLSKMKKADALLEIAKRLEEAALSDPYFKERKLYPNVDFYSGLIYRAIGIPINAFTVMFALGRLPGWIAHWREHTIDPSMKIGRPRQIYTGPTEGEYTPIGGR